MDEIVAAICGVCLHTRPAHHTPDFCGQCHARHDLGAPIALVRLDLEATTQRGSLELATRYDVEYLGTWCSEARAAVAEVFGHQHDPAARIETMPRRE